MHSRPMRGMPWAVNQTLMHEQQAPMASWAIDLAQCARKSLARHRGQ